MKRILAAFGRKRYAFTLIELLVAISVMGILSSIIVINFESQRRNSRDSIRKADTTAILAAVTKYASAKGSTAIAGTGGCAGLAGAGVDRAIAVTPTAGCTGVNGRSYGLINVVKSLSTKPDYVNQRGAGGGFSPKEYYPTTIAEALEAEGYFSSMPADPFQKKGKISGAPSIQSLISGDKWDYALIRACTNGDQHFANRGKIVAVWTILENDRGVNDEELLRVIPGFYEANGTTGYTYDFSAGFVLQGKFESKGWGVSNGAISQGATDSNC